MHLPLRADHSHLLPLSSLLQYHPPPPTILVAACFYTNDPQKKNHHNGNKMPLSLRSCNSAFVSRLNSSPPRCPLVLMRAAGSVDLTARAVGFWSEGSYGFGLVRWWLLVGQERFRYLEERKFWFGFSSWVGGGPGVHFGYNPWTKAHISF